MTMKQRSPLMSAAAVMATLGLLLSTLSIAPVVSFAPTAHRLGHSGGPLRNAVGSASNSRLYASNEEPLPSLNPAETAVLICKFQNDFAAEGGKIYETVREVMEITNMKENSIHFVDLARKSGCTIVHCPISLEPGQSCVTEMPFGVVERIRDANALQPGDWGSQIIEELTPQEGDLYSPKYGMCAFQTTDLDNVLRSRGIKNVIVMGFLTNGSVESTIRTAYELCYNVFCPTDCCAACSMVEQQCSIELNFGLFAWNANAVKLTSALMS